MGDGIRLPVSGMVGYTHRTEITGGSQGHGRGDRTVVMAYEGPNGQTITDDRFKRNCRVRDMVLTATGLQE